MKFLKHKYVGKRRFAAEWNAALDAYAKYLASIVSRLPESARQFLDHTKRRPLHDAVVEGILRPERRRLTIELDDRRLEFSGVRESECPSDLEEDVVWLYEEVDTAPGAFELRALWDNGELRVVAEEIRVYDKTTRRYVVPEQMPAEELRLFRDRKVRLPRRR